MYKKNRNKVRDSIAFGLFNNLLETMSYSRNSMKGEKTMNFFMMLHSISPQAFSAVSANLCGPSLQNLKKHMKKVHSSDCLIINCHHSKELCANAIVKYHKKMFSKDFPVAFSMSGDGTKVAQALTVLS